MKSAGTLKTKRGAPSTLSSKTQRGHLQTSKQKKVGPKSNLVKSTPGFSLYTKDEETTKAEGKSKGPRLMNGDQLLDAVSQEDNIVSQVQIVDSKSRDRLMMRHVDIRTNKPKAENIRSISPDFTAMSAVPPEVRTPFNKRLISSTPDPESLFSVLQDDNNTNFSNVNSNTGRSEETNPPLQMVPEKDNTTKPTDFDAISAMLMTQRQNQMIWQQQLEQFRHPPPRPPPVIEISDKPSAFQQWKGMDNGLTNPVLSDEMNCDFSKEMEETRNQNKAEWVASDALSKSDGKTEESTSSQDSRKKEEDNQVPQLSYNSYGTSSGPVIDSIKMMTVNDIATVEKVLPQNRGKATTVNGAKSSSSRNTQSDSKSKPSWSKPKDETNSSRDKMPMSSRTLKASTVGVKVLPVSKRVTQKKISDQPKLGVNRKVLSNKEQKDKVSFVAQPTDTVQKKKVLHVNLPRDERGLDVPPSFSSSDDDNDSDSEDTLISIALPQQSGDEIKTHANDSISTCGEEVNSLTSRESDESGDNPSTVVEADTKGKQSNLSAEKPEENVSSYNLIESKYGLNSKHLHDKNLAESLDFHNNMITNQNFHTAEVTTKEIAEHDLVLRNAESEINQQLDEASNPEEGDKCSKEGAYGISIRSDGVNTNQNYNDCHNGGHADERHQGTNRYRLHFLEKMADKTLMDIVCRLTLKATAIRDTELRDLIDDMIYNTDATLAREDGRFRSSQAFFMEENGKLKKRLHTVNKQLEAKERQERQGDLYPGISNNDVMHLERKNLYLRQEKERLDNQVTNLLEEKARWLVKQQDLVKTISLKDREILKLESKSQEEKKTLHKAVDEAAKNSQGVHFKLSVADREISNLEQRVKAKDQEIAELKDALKDVKDDLQCCVVGRAEKNKEIQSLQDLVHTFQEGVNEVMKAYESTMHNQHSTSEQRNGIDCLRRLVSGTLSTATSFSNIPQSQPPATAGIGNRQIQHQPNVDDRGRRFDFSTSTRQELPSQPQHHHHHYHHSRGGQEEQTYSRDQAEWDHQAHKNKQVSRGDKDRQHKQTTQKERQIDNTCNTQRHAPQSPQRQSHRHASGTDEGRDRYAADSSLVKDKGQRSRHGSGCGSQLTVQALEDHNRRLSPVDRTLWHSLDIGPVMPPLFAGEEPYHSDSEIHVVNAKTRRRKMEKERREDAEMRSRGGKHPNDEQWRRRRRRSDDFTDRQVLWRCRECVPMDAAESANKRGGGVSQFERDNIRQNDGRERGRNKDRGLEDGGNYRRRNQDYEYESQRNARNMDKDVGPRDFESNESTLIRTEQQQLYRRERSREMDYDDERVSRVLGREEQLVHEHSGRNLEGQLPYDLESVTLYGDENDDSDVDRSRYSVTDYFKKYPVSSQSHRYTSTQRAQHHHHQQQQQEREREVDKSFPMNSKDYWVDSGTADDPDLDAMVTRHRSQGHQGPSIEQPQSHSQSQSFRRDTQYPSLESVSIAAADNQSMPPPPTTSMDRRGLLEPMEESMVFHSSKQRQPQHSSTSNQLAGQQSLRLGQILLNPTEEESSQPHANPLSSSYPTLNSTGVVSSSNQHTSRTATVPYSDDRFPSLHSTSLPNSSQTHHHPHHNQSDRHFRREDLVNDQPPYSPPTSSQQHRREYDQSSQLVNTRIGGQSIQYPNEPASPSYRFVERSIKDGMHASASNRNDRPLTVTFRDPSVEEDSLTNQPSHSFQSQFLNDRTSFPPHSSPVTTSDISLSRRATRGSETSQHDFFRGTELSASYSSISDTDLAHQDYNSSARDLHGSIEYGEESFNTGIASLDSKIADLEAKISRTKSVFS